MRSLRFGYMLVSIPLLLTYSWFVYQPTADIQGATFQGPPDPTPTTTSFPIAEDSWIYVDLPPNATQLDYGWEIYRLVCSACHAYDGTGLTDRWRSTWGVEDQNCWQSKCHASNHPPDGFELPFAPAIVGSGIRAQFATAYDLYVYNYNTMPWHDPRSMMEEEVWAVTAFVLQLNRINPGPVLTADTARDIVINPRLPTPIPENGDPPPILEPTPTLHSPALRSEPELAFSDLLPAGLDIAAVWIGLAILAVFVATYFLFLHIIR